MFLVGFLTGAPVWGCVGFFICAALTLNRFNELQRENRALEMQNRAFRTNLKRRGQYARKLLSDEQPGGEEGIDEGPGARDTDKEGTI